LRLAGWGYFGVIPFVLTWTGESVNYGTLISTFASKFLVGIYVSIPILGFLISMLGV
jgi:hypothetical protein